MKKISLLLAILMLGSLVKAQNSKDIFAAALVPDAPLVVYVDNAKNENTPFVQTMKKYEEDAKKLAELPHKVPEQFEKNRKVIENILKDLGLDQNYWCVKFQASASVGGVDLKSLAGESPDLSPLDVLLAFELKKPLTATQVKAAIDKGAAESGADTSKVELALNKRNDVELLTIIIKDDDIPEALHRLQTAFIGDGKIILCGLEKSVFAALDRIAAKTPATLAPYVKKQIETKDNFFALAFFPQLKDLISQFSPKEDDPMADPNKAMLGKAFSNAEGFCFDYKITDKCTISLNFDMGSVEDATMLKGEIWDGQIAPMLEQFKPMVPNFLGAPLPMVNTINFVADGTHTALSFALTEADCKVVMDVIKKHLSAKVQANPANVPAAPADQAIPAE